MVLCAYALAACGSDSESSTSSQTASDATVSTAPTGTAATTVTTPPAAKPKPPKVTPAPLPANGKTVAVPDVVGQTLEQATAAMGAAGLILDAEALSGDRSQIQNSWEVCKTVPGPNRKTAKGSPVAVISAPAGQC
jgi:hypothetical protein